MFYYKEEKSGKVFAYDEELPPDVETEMVAISPEEARAYADSYIDPETSPTYLERLWRNKEISRADVELNKVQDSDPKAKGTVAEWREYRKQLRAWPSTKGFPNKQYRPKAPDAK